MLAGSGTIGIEILDELPEVTAIYVPVGGGGLVAAIGSVIKELRPAVEIIGVQSMACPLSEQPWTPVNRDGSKQEKRYVTARWCRWWSMRCTHW